LVDFPLINILAPPLQVGSLSLTSSLQTL
jgi:hypothetical protein